MKSYIGLYTHTRTHARAHAHTRAHTEFLLKPHGVILMRNAALCWTAGVSPLSSDDLLDMSLEEEHQIRPHVFLSQYLQKQHQTRTENPFRLCSCCHVLICEVWHWMKMSGGAFNAMIQRNSSGGGRMSLWFLVPISLPVFTLPGIWIMWVFINTLK